METRGYIIPFWPSEQCGPGTVQIYETLLAASVASFRACSGPGPDLLVLDIEGSLSEPTREAIRPLCRIWSGRNMGPGIPWERNCYNKLLALAGSPYGETCLMDADLIWTGDAGDVFDQDTAKPQAQIAGVHCPQYHRGHGCCACLTICRDHEAAHAAIALRADLEHPDNDEDAFDLAEERGLITRARLPPKWAFDGRALVGRGPGPFHDWKNPAKWEHRTWPYADVWTVDGNPIRSFHVSGIKRPILRNKRIAAYLDACAEKLENVRP